MVSAVRISSDSEHDLDGVIATAARTDEPASADGRTDPADVSMLDTVDVTDLDAPAPDPDGSAAVADASAAVVTDPSAAMVAGVGAPSAGAVAPDDITVRTLKRPFRLPGAGDPVPAGNRVLALSGWAALLGLLGLIPAGRLTISLLFQSGPPWYPPMTVGVGIAGMATIAAAFAAVHRRRLPWIMLGLATVLLLVNLALAYTAP